MAGSTSRGITSVTFTGGVARPTITIRGHGLGTRPGPNPTYAPVGHPPLCPPQPTKPLKAYGLDYGTRWTTPDPSTPTYKAMKMYRNYDGNLSTFGDTSVSAAVPNPDQLSAFAATRTSDGALTVMVINKIAGSTPVTLSLANFAAVYAAQAWQLTSANSIARLADVSVGGGVATTTVPGRSWRSWQSATPPSATCAGAG